MTSKILAAAAVAIMFLSLVPFGVVVIGMIVASGIVGYAVQLATGHDAIVYETNETRTEEWEENGQRKTRTVTTTTRNGETKTEVVES